MKIKKRKKQKNEKKKRKMSKLLADSKLFLSVNHMACVPILGVMLSLSFQKYNYNLVFFHSEAPYWIHQ